MQITSLYAALLTVLYMFLSLRIITIRRGRLVDMGDGDDPLLRRLVRGHGNCAEYAPLALILLGLVEYGGWPGWVVHLLGVMLLAGRLAHAWAFSAIQGRPLARVSGMVLTTTMLFLAALACLVQALGAG